MRRSGWWRRAGALIAGLGVVGLAAARGVEAPPPPAGAAEEAPAKPVAKGPRDPFRPFTLEMRPWKTNPKTPLEQYELSALKLVAIIWSPSDPKAMVEDAGGIGYTIGVGTAIGPRGGVVKTIAKDEVVVEEEFTDFYGEKKKSETVLQIETEGGAKQ